MPTKPVSIQPPINRAIGQWVADIRISGKSYTLPVLHAHNFDKAAYYNDEMKMTDGSPARGRRYEEHIAALTNFENDQLIIVQRTKTDADGKRSNGGYAGVFKFKDLKLTDNGYSLARGQQVAMFSR